jgi:hypothetical protein
MLTRQVASLRGLTGYEPQAGGCPQNTETVNYTTIQINKTVFYSSHTSKVNTRVLLKESSRSKD